MDKGIDDEEEEVQVIAGDKKEAEKLEGGDGERGEDILKTGKEEELKSGEDTKADSFLFAEEEEEDKLEDNK